MADAKRPDADSAKKRKRGQGKVAQGGAKTQQQTHKRRRTSQEEIDAEEPVEEAITSQVNGVSEVDASARAENANGEKLSKRKRRKQAQPDSAVSGRQNGDDAVKAIVMDGSLVTQPNQPAGQDSRLTKKAMKRLRREAEMLDRNSDPVDHADEQAQSDAQPKDNGFGDGYANGKTVDKAERKRLKKERRKAELAEIDRKQNETQNQKAPVEPQNIKKKQRNVGKEQQQMDAAVALTTVNLSTAEDALNEVSKPEETKPTAAKKSQSASGKAPQSHESMLQKRAETTPKSAWTLSRPTAGRFLDHDPVFAEHNGEQFIITANGREIQIFSVDTSLLVRSLPATERCFVNTYALDPAEPNMLTVALSDNSLQVWDWTSGKSQFNDSALRLGGEPRAMALKEMTVEGREALVSICRSGKNSSIFAGSIPIYKTPEELHSVRVLGENGRYVVAASTAGIVVGCKSAGLQSSQFRWLEIPSPELITCMDAKVAAAKLPGKKLLSDALSVAIGNEGGQILVYEDLLPHLQAGKNAPQTASLSSPRILHWHPEGVASIKFSQDGNYLISGGKEAVLVLWQLETGKKQFLPHLPSEIERIVISPSGDRYAIQLADNSIMVLSTSELKPVANFAGLQAPVAANDSKSAPMPHLAAVLHPRHPQQVLLTVPISRPASAYELFARPFLQTFDLRTARHVSRQALARNTATDLDFGPNRNPVVSPDVHHIALGPDGKWLATVDEWMPSAADVDFLAPNETVVQEERMKRREVYLKIWNWDEAQDLWTLSTRFDAPHTRVAQDMQGAGRILALVADPTSTAFATIGEDSSVKIWKPKTRTRNGVAVRNKEAGSVVDWTCRHIICLEKEAERADSPMGIGAVEAPQSACIAHSDDGSILAATLSYGYGVNSATTHFIDAHSGQIRSSKASMCMETLIDVRFLDRYFISLSSKQVSVWDVVMDKFHYAVNLRSMPRHSRPLLAVDAVGGTFAIASPKGISDPPRIDVFDPKQSKTVYKQELDVPVTALLSPKSSRGYTALFADATLRTLLPAARSATLPSPTVNKPLPAADEIGPEQEEEDEEMANAASSVNESGKPALVIQDDENDRPVVRPEQLASIFDVGQSFALPPVKDMFDAVVGLYSRPLRSAEAGVEV